MMASAAGSGHGKRSRGQALARDLLQSLPGAVAYVSGPDLTYGFANQEYQRIVGERDLIGVPLHEVLPEFAPESLAGVRRVAQTGEPFLIRESQVWIRRHGGKSERLFMDFACEPVRDDAGHVAGVLLCGSDVTQRAQDRRRLETLAKQLVSSEARYRTLCETLPQGCIYCDRDGSILSANPAASEILGIAPRAITRWPVGDAERAVHQDGTPFQLNELPVMVALRTGEVVADVVVGLPHGRTGEPRWLRVTAIPDSWDEQGRARRAFVMFADITGQRRAEEERAALLAREQAARAEAGVVREHLTFLLRAGDLLAATRNPDDLLEQVTQLVVPALADYCVAFMPTPEGRLRATRLTHRDPAVAEALVRLREHPIPAEGPLISQVAYTTGAIQLASEFSAQAPAWAAAAPELMRIVDQARPASALAVPLLAGKQPLGVLVLGRGRARPRFAAADKAVAEELARRMAAGLANVETFAREHSVAETLQHALLPDPAPPVEGLDLAVRYLPASDGVHVGGDWYDAFPLDHHRVGLAIGDVAGHSIDSAAIMGQVRSLLHGYAIDSPSPPDVLRRTNAAICQMLPDALATIWYAVLELSEGELAYASAGHPPALFSSGHGHAEYLDVPPATMVGASPDTVFTADKRRLPPGARLLLYTDGLIEDRHRDISDGLAALAAALARSAGRTAEDACQAAQAALLGSAPLADDVCILAISLLPGRPRPGG